MIWYTLYSRKDPPCEYCDQARELLKVYGCNYYEVDINEDGIRDMFKERGFRTVPQVFRETTHIGGFNALSEFLKKEKLDEEVKYRSKGKGTSFKSA